MVGSRDASLSQFIKYLWFAFFFSLSLFESGALQSLGVPQRRYFIDSCQNVRRTLPNIAENIVTEKSVHLIHLALYCLKAPQ